MRGVCDVRVAAGQGPGLGLGQGLTRQRPGLFESLGRSLAIVFVEMYTVYNGVLWMSTRVQGNICKMRTAART